MRYEERGSDQVMMPECRHEIAQMLTNTAYKYKYHACAWVCEREREGGREKSSTISGYSVQHEKSK